MAGKGFGSSGLMDQIRAEADSAVGRPGHSDLVEFTYDKVATRASIFLTVTLTGASLGWAFLPVNLLSPLPYLLLIFGAAFLGVFAGRQLIKNNPIGLPLAFAYCLIQGGVLGLVSRAFDTFYGDGIVSQAVLATITTAVAVVWYSRTPLGRKTGRAVKLFTTVIIGYVIFLVVNLFLGFAGVGGGFGLHGLGILGLGLCLFGCLLAAWSLNVDVTAAHDMNGQHTPDTLIWASAFSINVTLIWLYLEILRLIAVARR